MTQMKPPPENPGRFRPIYKKFDDPILDVVRF